jgi:hypothetical protein
LPFFLPISHHTVGTSNCYSSNEGKRPYGVRRTERLFAGAN